MQGLTALDVDIRISTYLNHKNNNTWAPAIELLSKNRPHTTRAPSFPGPMANNQGQMAQPPFHAPPNLGQMAQNQGPLAPMVFRIDGHMSPDSIKKTPVIPPEKLRVDYWSCTGAELRRFVKARTGKEAKASGFMSMIDQLEELDANPPPFRFLDLVAELRLPIYAELLHNLSPNSSKKLYPQILATCKTIYKEAQEDFVKNSHLDIVLEAKIQPAASANEVIPHAIHCSVMGGPPTCNSTKSYEEIMEVRARMAGRFKGARRCRVRISFSIDGDDPYGNVDPWLEMCRGALSLKMARLLLAISSALRQRFTPVVDVELEDRGVMYHRRSNLHVDSHFAMLWPLCYSSGVQFTMRGIDDEPELMARLSERSALPNAIPDALAECERHAQYLFALSSSLCISQNATMVLRAHVTTFKRLFEENSTLFLVDVEMAMENFESVKKDFEEMVRLQGEMLKLREQIANRESRTGDREER